jgi:hypothetical protein
MSGDLVVEVWLKLVEMLVEAELETQHFSNIYMKMTGNSTPTHITV